MNGMKWKNGYGITGTISLPCLFLSYDDNFYELLPYEEITVEEYEKRKKEMKPFNPSLLSKYEAGGIRAGYRRERVRERRLPGTVKHNNKKSGRISISVKRAAVFQNWSEMQRLISFRGLLILFSAFSLKKETCFSRARFFGWRQRLL